MDYEAQVKSVLRIATIAAPDRYEWFGQISEGLPAKVRRGMRAEEVREGLHFELTQRLYSSFYSFGAPQAAPPQLEPSDADANRRFLKTLSEANHGSGCWSGGFTLLGREGDNVVVERNDLTLRASGGDCRTADGSELEIGREVEMRLPKEQLGISPGFYLAQSNRAFDKTADKAIVRVYWNLTPEGAVRVTSGLTEQLNVMDVAFRFKVLSQPHQYVRRDAGVLYFHKPDIGPVLDVVNQVWADAEAFLRPGVPAFVKPLKRSVGLAEDAPGQPSFGWHRCSVLAESILRAHEAGYATFAEREEHVHASFEKQGVRLSTPFLSEGSDELDVGGHESPIDRPVVVRELAVNERAGRKACLNTAATIAQQLASSALWHEERCTWFGPDLPSSAAHDEAASEARSALGPTLYSGLSGVSWFLAEVARATGERAITRVAGGAAHQAVFRMSSPTVGPHDHGLYFGWAGVLLGVAYTARVLDEPQLSDAVRSCIEKLPEAAAESREFDITVGRAGSILALLGLASMLDVPKLVDRARALGAELCDLADWSRDACSWPAHGANAQPQNLTGYSHGTAGVAHALAELFSVTSETRFADVARGAVRYESLHFSKDAKNWPDFRQPQNPPRFMSAWCHGAPGIALSRVRTAQLLKEPKHKVEAETALETTADSIDSSLASDNDPGGLCHGLLSKGAILGEGAYLLGMDNQRYSDAVERVAAVAIASLRSDHTARNDPGLMLGGAGLGLFLLSVAEPTTPSVLMVQPSALTHDRPSGKHAAEYTR